MARAQLASRALLLLLALLLLSLSRVETEAAGLAGRPMARSLFSAVSLGSAPPLKTTLVIVSGREAVLHADTVQTRFRETWGAFRDLWHSWGGTLP